MEFDIPVRGDNRGFSLKKTFKRKNASTCFLSFFAEGKLQSNVFRSLVKNVLREAHHR